MSGNLFINWEGQAEKNLLLMWIELFELIKSVFSFMSVSSLFIGLTGFFQTMGGCILLATDPSISSCTSVFLMAFSVYSLNKLTDIKEDAVNTPERLRFLKGRERLVLAYSLGAYLLSGIIAFFDNPWGIPIILIPIAANAVYGSKLIPGIPRLKDIPVVKNLFVALSWALVCVLLPAIHMSETAYIPVALIIYFMVVKDFVNTTLFDVRDIKGDKENGIRTIPVLLGQKRTIAVLIAANSTLIPWLALVSGAIRPFAALLILYEFAFILYFGRTRNPAALELLVDGEWTLTCAAFGLLRAFGAMA